MTKDEALKLALEALERGETELRWQAITAIKEALAQPEQCQCSNCRVTLHASDCAVHNEPAYPAGGCDCGAQQGPVAWMWRFESDEGAAFSTQKPTISIRDGVNYVPLYTTPPQRKPLTDEHPLVVFAKECVLGAYQESELADAAKRAIEAARGIKGDA